MQNKIHDIMDHAWDHPAVDEVHTMRVGLITNTVGQARPVVITDLDDIMLEEPKVDLSKIIEELPLIVHFGVDHLIAVLIVLDADSGKIQCYPFSNDNEHNKWFVYDIAFDIVDHDKVEVRPVHPWVTVADDLYQETYEHMEALASVCMSFLTRLGEGTLVESEDNFERLNKKRTKNGKFPRRPNWNLICGSQV
jgi:hypothetical protein